MLENQLFPYRAILTQQAYGHIQQDGQAIYKFSNSTSLDLMAGKHPTGFGKGRLLQVAEMLSVNSGVLSLYLVYKIIEHLFMIKICLTLNEGQGQNN